MFDKESLEGCDGVTGNATAISMAKGHIVNWFTPEGLIGAELTSSTTLNSKRSLVDFGNNKVTYKSGGSVVLTVSKLTDASTGSVLLESFGGNARVSADSTTPDADLEFAAKGSGEIKFGTHSAIGAESLTGYITIKDSSGVTRKLAVVS